MAAALRGPGTLTMPSSSSDRPAAKPEFTRFERARILGARALQISLGAPILVDTPPELVDPVAIAEREFDAGVIPIAVRRGPPAAG
ncbi:MAG: DNA-directed RNA polymerase subunit K [Thermoplasmata archaeon]